MLSRVGDVERVSTNTTVMKLHRCFFILPLALFTIATQLQAQTPSDSARWDLRFLPNSWGSNLKVVAGRPGVFIAGNGTGIPVQLGSTIFHGLAHWDGSHLTDLLPDTSIHGEIGAMALDSAGNLYVAGYFQRLGTLIKYDGKKWTTIDTDYALAGTVSDMATQDSLLLLSESYSDSSGNSGIRLTIYDGHTYRHIPLDGISLSRIAVKRDTVYLNGTGLAWISPDSVRLRCILKWDGHRCSELPNARYDVFDLYANDSVVIVMGKVDSIIGNKPSMFGLWDRNKWTNLQDSVHSSGGGVHVSYLGNTLYSTNSLSLSHWENSSSSWVQDMTLAQPPRQVASTGDQLVLVGVHTCDSINIPNILFWDSGRVSSPWSGPMLGLDSRIMTMTTFGDQLIVGGEFSTAGSKYVHRIAAWNGTEWSSLGRDRYSYFWKSIPESFDAYDDKVTVLLPYKGSLYAAGRFTQMDGIPANNIARWDGTSWHALGDGIVHLSDGGQSSIHAMTILDDGSLLVAGWFDSAGGVSARNIAIWDGQGWHTLDTVLNNADINAIASYGDTIFAGGGMVVDTERHVMMRTSNGWSVLGDDLNGTVRALAWSGDTLYACGDFTASGSVPILHVAKWDGKRWQQVGRGFASRVNTLKVINGKLLACTNQNYDHQIFQWSNGDWIPFGTAANNSINALELFQGGICVGGAFTTVGDSASYHFGILQPPAGWLDVATPSDTKSLTTLCPNPTDGIVHITIPSDAQELSITTMLGERVIDVPLSPRSEREMQCDLSKYPNGIYLVRIKRSNGVDLEKAIKE